MCRIFLTALASLVVPATMLAQSAYQISYFPNTDTHEGVVDIANGGADTSNGYLCANVYAFDPHEEMIACCSCLISPDQTQHFLVSGVISHRLTPAVPTSITLKLLATAPAFSFFCNAAAPGGTVTGMAAWGIKTHLVPTTVTTETAFAQLALTTAEVGRLTSQCSAIGLVGSGYGMCPGCTVGALAVPK